MIGKGSTFAVVGSWNTLDEYDQRQHLALLTLGVFVSARDIKPVTPGESPGGAVDASTKWPLGLPLKQKPPLYRISGDTAVAAGKLEATGVIPLSPKSRVLKGERYLQYLDDTYVAESDVAVVRRRNEFPDFVGSNTHWIDVDSTKGILVLYEGNRPVHVTRTCLVPERPWPSGTLWVRTKQVTDLNPQAESATGELYSDTPWMIELDSGLKIYGSVGKAQVEVGRTSSSLCLEAEDAQKVFRFLQPELPIGWHAVNAERSHGERSPVLIH